MLLMFVVSLDVCFLPVKTELRKCVFFPVVRKSACFSPSMMIQASNVLILDEPTDHLDMESITALNNGLIKFPGVILFASRDHQVVQTTANRIIEFLPDGTFVDKVSSYDEYLENDEMARKRQVYSMSDDDASDN